MALIRCDFWSEALEMSTSMTVLLPDGDSADPPPVVYLLHGLTDDHTAWTRFSSVERYAEEHGVAVVMPSVDRSFYANETYGMRFWDFLSAELPERVGRFFRVSARREDTFVPLGRYQSSRPSDRNQAGRTHCHGQTGRTHCHG
ncbi:alpha/beta hydrolase, partial [Actinoplanes philippinensis]|uniref:alpha/beta hydrolase n=1 Tax=Actinoplanes philippinensis TaxID=35752 RepID=UPI0033F4DC85